MAAVELCVRLDGVQSSKKDVVTMPFNFEEQVLRGGALERNVLNAFIQLSFADMVPDNKGQLFNWSELAPDQMITYVSAYHTLNDAMNSNAIREHKKVLPVNDEEILKRTARTGMMTPRQIEERYPPRLSSRTMAMSR